PKLHETARRLRRRAALGPSEFNISRSIAMTCTRAGAPSLIYGRRATTVSWIVLVERAHVHDQFALLICEYFRALQREGPKIEIYVFDRDPRRQRALSFRQDGTFATGPEIPLEQLASGTQERALVFVSDGTCLLTAGTSNLAVWHDLFLSWE